jgi:hypothetical protein
MDSESQRRELSEDERGAFWSSGSLICPSTDSFVQILRQHFGLEVTFSHTRASLSEIGKWPEDRNLHWHDEDHRETTICHLTVSRRKHVEDEWISSDFEDHMGSFFMEGTQTLGIDTELLSRSGDFPRRFQRAMQYLGLQPSPHPSQKYCKLRPVAEAHASRSETGDNSFDEEKVQTSQRK